MYKHVEVFEQMIGYVKDELGVHFDSSDFKKHSDEVLEILKTPSTVSFVLTEHSPDDIEPIKNQNIQKWQLKLSKAFKDINAVIHSGRHHQVHRLHNHYRHEHHQP